MLKTTRSFVGLDSKADNNKSGIVFISYIWAIGSGGAKRRDSTGRSDTSRKKLTKSKTQNSKSW